MNLKTAEPEVVSWPVATRWMSVQWAAAASQKYTSPAGTATLPAGLFTPTPSSQQAPASFYMLGPNQLVAIGTQNGVYSGISFIDPE